MATVTDEIIDLHDRILGKLFNAAKNKHQQQFQASGKAINAKVRLYGRIGQALIDAKQSGRDPFVAIEAVMSWDAFAESVTEAQKLAQPDDFDFLHRIGESYATLRRYAPEFLDILKLRAAPAAKNVLDAIDVLRGMNTDNARKVPADAPTGFIKPRWQKLVMTDAGIDRRYYELCALSELKNALRSGDIWVQGLTPVQGLRGLLGAAREIRQPQAVQRIAAGRDHRLRPVPARPADTVGSTARHGQPHGGGQRPAGCHHHRVGPEDHTARRSGARHRAGADRPDGHDPAARQDHRTAA
jgi:Transposase.